MDSWKEVVQPTNQETKECRPTQIKLKKTTCKKKTNQRNKKSRSVTTLIPKKPRSVKTQTPEHEESRSEEDASTPQRLVSVAGHPKNCLYIDSGAFLHIIFNNVCYWEVLSNSIGLSRFKLVEYQFIYHKSGHYTKR